MTPKEQLTSRITNKTAHIAIIGLGYVGLPLAVEYAKKGFKTIGFDVSERKVNMLNAGKNYIGDVNDADLLEVVQSGGFLATTDAAALEEADVLYICVPTPITANKEPDLSFIYSASEAVAARLRTGQLVVLKSTTFPGTTEDHVQPILEKRGLKLGEEYFLAFSPERIDPGNTQWTTSNTPVVVGGVTPTCTALTALAVRQIVQHIHEVSSPKVAELEKLLENIFRSVNIALVNELAQLCERMGNISVWEVVEAAATKPYGFMPFYPGPGLGGHCIPIDPYYLSWLARKYDFEAQFITLSGNVNDSMPFHVMNKVMEVLADQPKTLKQAKVLILGVAFKKDVDDMRHSPALKIMELLTKKGITIEYTDPHVADLKEEGFPLTSRAISKEMLKEYDCAILVTNHSLFDYDFIAAHSSSIIDTRNAFKSIVNRSNIRLLGFESGL